MLSWVAVERMVDRQTESDRAYRKKVSRRPSRSAVRKLSEEALIGRLRDYGVDCDRDWLGALVRQHLSAEAIARSLGHRPDGGGERDGEETTWIWACISVLWERWFPEEPSFENLDDAMQDGYDAQGRLDSVAACRLWLGAWKDAVYLGDKAQVETGEAFDALFQREDNAELRGRGAAPRSVCGTPRYVDRLSGPGVLESTREGAEAQSGAKRPVSVRERQEVQEVLRAVRVVIIDPGEVWPCVPGAGNAARRPGGHPPTS